jgi:hypothetical protein
MRRAELHYLFFDLPMADHRVRLLSARTDSSSVTTDLGQQMLWNRAITLGLSLAFLYLSALTITLRRVARGRPLRRALLDQNDTGIVSMENRIAPLRHEIDKIMSGGPIGCWSNPPTTFPMMEESVLFNADGSGLATSWSGMMGTSTQAFEWSMQSPGRLVMRYGDRKHDDSASGTAEEDDRDETTPVIFDIEIKIQETEFAPWPVMTNRSSDVFGFLWCALARDDPPLVLPRPPVAQTRRTLRSRMQDLVARYF